MQLTMHTDFGLRLLMTLARRGAAPLSAAEFAQEQNLSYNHMAKVVRSLTMAGFVKTIRGRTGGVILARGPEEFSVGDVVRALEPGMCIVDCSNCVMRDDCRLQGLLGEAMTDFLARLDQMSLAEIARKREAAIAVD